MECDARAFSGGTAAPLWYLTTARLYGIELKWIENQIRKSHNISGTNQLRLPSNKVECITQAFS